jgi:hypothetical protein
LIQSCVGWNENWQTKEANRTENVRIKLAIFEIFLNKTNWGKRFARFFLASGEVLKGKEIKCQICLLNETLYKWSFMLYGSPPSIYQFLPFEL